MNRGPVVRPEIGSTSVPMRIGPAQKGAKLSTLESMSRIVEDQKRLSDDLRRKVRAARRWGCTWAEIGAALGVTGSSAQERFGPLPKGAGRKAPLGK